MRLWGARCKVLEGMADLVLDFLDTHDAHLDGVGLGGVDAVGLRLWGVGCRVEAVGCKV